mmetsp:Transcript_69293/g.207955  ORF Transcript_69293/g.207955 Transcript_69293/m.207955 type:complete len:206 (-) Transcript_69293:390-1007(-)
MVCPRNRSCSRTSRWWRLARLKIRRHSSQNGLRPLGGATSDGAAAAAMAVVVAAVAVVVTVVAATAAVAAAERCAWCIKGGRRRAAVDACSRVRLRTVGVVTTGMRLSRCRLPRNCCQSGCSGRNAYQQTMGRLAGRRSEETRGSCWRRTAQSTAVLAACSCRAVHAQHVCRHRLRSHTLPWAAIIEGVRELWRRHAKPASRQSL